MYFKITILYQKYQNKRLELLKSDSTIYYMNTATVVIFLLRKLKE